MKTVCYLVIEVLVDKKKTGKSFAEMILFVPCQLFSKVCHADELFQMFKANAFPLETSHSAAEKKVHGIPKKLFTLEFKNI